MAENTIPIPSPPGLPLLGNINDINSEFPLGSLVNLADKYGEIYKLALPGRTLVVVSTQALVNELCDEKRFHKSVASGLKEVRNGVGDGLFTAYLGEPNWAIAHRVLMPAFGPMSIKDMFDDMHDIASQLVMKWARHGSATPIMVTDDFTRLALDTLALCSMDYRFNSYYHDEMHPFIKAMASFLVESGNRSRRAPLPSFFYREADRKYQEDIDVLRKTASDVLKLRKENPNKRKDLLNAMLNNPDPKTGEKMSDQSITDNLITFLIAGHETTSGLLSFAFHQLLKNPDAYRKVQEEVDEVIGDGPVNVDHIPKLHYIQAVLRETLRMSSPIPIISVEPYKDEIIGGKYQVKPGDQISLLLFKSQVDPAVFGDTANDFIPDRMFDDNFNRLNKEFPNFWKPFGNGVRACIGRPFAWQEATMVMAMLFQNLNFVLDDPSYQLNYKQTLTIKPKNLYIRATLRDRLTPTKLEHRLNGTASPQNGSAELSRAGSVNGLSDVKGDLKPMSIYYGSNAGTCESMAQRLATNAPAHGFTATAVDSLDATNRSLPTDRPVVIITASYEGEPPDNAVHFCNWLEGLKGKELENVSYAVFGCGHHDWAQTFHKIPKMVDSTVERLGGSRVAPIGLCDAADDDMFTVFETWEDEQLWPALREKYGVKEGEDGAAMQGGLSVEISSSRSNLRQDVQEAQVIATDSLTAPGAPLKKHMEVQLPSDMTYKAGDYLAVLPLNPKDVVHRAMRRFHLPWDAQVTIHARGCTTLPTGVPISVVDVLGAYLELSRPATRRCVAALAEAAKDDDTKQQLQRLAGDDYTAEVSAKRVSVLDLLERHAAAVELPFASFLALLPPMRVRQYSISSSPLWSADRLALTYSVLDAPALSGSGRRHVGVASSYLASLAPGDTLHVSVRPSPRAGAFRLPADPERSPVVMIAAGSGLAPFRGFVQERAAMMAAGRRLAPALLFFGCRAPGVDDLYREELDRWEALGAVDVRRAYSRDSEAAKGGGCRHVQDRLWRDRKDVHELWDQGAKVFVCGSRGVGEGVRQVAIRMYADRAKELGKELSEEEATEMFDAVRNVRYATDVFD